METGSDPYTSLLESFGGAGAAQASKGALQMFLGAVKRASPLEIDVNGTVQRAADGNVWCNPALTAPREVSIPVQAVLSGGSISTLVTVGESQISTVPINGGSAAGRVTATIPAPGFQAGDRLILLTRDQQTFYILCKEAPL